LVNEGALDLERPVLILVDDVRYGSGYLIGGRLVLTVAHLFPEGEETRCKVRPRGARPGWEDVPSGTVRWLPTEAREKPSDPPPEADIALVELDEGVDPCSPVVFGRFPDVSGAVIVPCEMYGWPRWTKPAPQDDRLGGVHVPGKIYLADTPASGLLAVEPDRVPDLPTPKREGSDWEGFSGAAVVCAGSVVAVQRWHWNPQRDKSLEAVPLSRFFADEEFRRLLVQSGIPLETKDVLPQGARDLTGPAFVVGKPVPHARFFYGRRQELSRLLKMLQRPPLQNAAIFGPKRSGKTSLLRHLRNLNTTPPGDLRPGQRPTRVPEMEKYRWAYVDFQDPRMGTRKHLLTHLLVALDYPPGGDVSLETFLSIVLQRLSSPTVILLDEIGVALERYSRELDDTFWEALRFLASSPEGANLAFVLAAHQSPSEIATSEGLGSPFFNIFGFSAGLGPLTPEEARELATSSPRPFAAEDVDWIVDISGRWPILLQILCAERLAALEENDRTESWKESGLRQMRQHSHLLKADGS
jgi:hypothetical protein